MPDISELIGTIPRDRLIETMKRGNVSTLYGRDACVVEFESREPLDPESSAYKVGIVVDQGDLEAFCKQVPGGRACPSMGHRGRWCKHVVAALVLWQQALEG